MFKKLLQLVELKLISLTKEIKLIDKQMETITVEQKLYTNIGMKFVDLIDRYPISEDELLSMSETVCKFVLYTRRTNIDDYLFLDKELEKPRLPYMLK